MTSQNDERTEVLHLTKGEAGFVMEAVAKTREYHDENGRGVTATVYDELLKRIEEETSDDVAPEIEQS